MINTPQQSHSIWKSKSLAFLLKIEHSHYHKTKELLVLPISLQVQEFTILMENHHSLISKEHTVDSADPLFPLALLHRFI